MSPDDTVAYVIADGRLTSVLLATASPLASAPLEQAVKLSPTALKVSGDGSLVAVLHKDYDDASGRLTVYTAPTLGPLRSHVLAGVTEALLFDESERYLYAVQNRNQIARLGVDEPSVDLIDYTPAGLRLNALEYLDGQMVALSGTMTVSLFRPPYPPFHYSEYKERYRLERLTDGQLLWSSDLDYMRLGLGPGGTQPKEFPGTLFAGARRIYFDPIAPDRDPEGPALVDVESRATLIKLGSILQYPYKASTQGNRLMVRESGPSAETIHYVVDGTPQMAYALPDARYAIQALGGAAGEFVARLNGGQSTLFDRDGVPIGTMDCANGDPTGCNGNNFAVWAADLGLLIADGNALRIWDVAARRRLSTWQARKTSDYHLGTTVSHDGSMLATLSLLEDVQCTPSTPCTRPRMIQLFELPELITGTGASRLSFLPPVGYSDLGSALFSRDDSRLHVHAFSDDPARADRLLSYSTADGRLLASVPLPKGENPGTVKTSAMTLDADGGRLFVSLRGYMPSQSNAPAGGIYAFSTSSLGYLGKFSTNPAQELRATHDGALLVVADDRNPGFSWDKFGEVTMLDARTGDIVYTLEFNSANASHALYVAPASSTLQTAVDGVLAEWMLNTPEVEFLRDRESLLTSRGAEGRDRNWDGVLDAADLVYTTIRR